MALLLIDLDNTLIDRDEAFRRAVSELLAEHDLPPEDVDWVMSIDLHGYAPRAEVGELMHSRWAGRVSWAEIARFLSRGASEHVVLDAEVESALRKAISAGWTAVVVTNGGAGQQRTKLRVTGLDEIVAGWAISASVGSAKPAPEIFEYAARTVDGDLEGAWMIGDSAPADIGGAAGLGLSSVWISLGRTWPADLPFKPTAIAATFSEAIDVILA